MNEPGPVQMFIGGALVAVGFMVALLCGGCGVLFFIGFVVSGLMSSNHEDVSMALIPLFVGGIPAAVGFGLLVAGRSLRKGSRP